MDSNKSNKMSEIVRLQQILKKWKKLANAPKSTNKSSCSSSGGGGGGGGGGSGSGSSSNNGSKSIKFLKKTLSFSDSSMAAAVVPKGFLAVCVGKELKRFIIPTEYLGHQAFGILLREAEEEFGFEQEGVLKIPCQVPLFEKILRLVQEKKEVAFLPDFAFNLHMKDMNNNNAFFSPDSKITQPPSHHPQLCT